MSGLPSVEGVTKFRLNLRRFSDARDHARRLMTQIAELKKELEGQNIEEKTARNLMLKALTDMDVYSSGNTGFEDRAMSFYKELFDQMGGRS